VDKRNVRLVTVNRPDYPGATPLSDKERMQLGDIAQTVDQDSQLAANALLHYIKENAMKAYDFLEELICCENIPAAGGIILAGWSFGVSTILGLLANANAISSKKVDLRSYIKHLVIYGEYINGYQGFFRAILIRATIFLDPPSFILGYTPPTPNVFNPFFDPSLSTGEALKIFGHWVSAYYAHGEDLTKLEYEALEHPAPTIPSMDHSDVRRCMEISPVLPGGSDERFIRLGVQLGVFAQLKDAVIYLDKGREQDSQVVNRWDDVEIKYVWCDRSVWEMTWGALCLQADLDDSKKAGRVIRKVDMVRLRGGNHFVSFYLSDLRILNRCDSATGINPSWPSWDCCQVCNSEYILNFRPHITLISIIAESSAPSDISHSKYVQQYL
jgi:hypothetical protein